MKNLANKALKVYTMEYTKTYICRKGKCIGSFKDFRVSRFARNSFLTEKNCGDYVISDDKKSIIVTAHDGYEARAFAWEIAIKELNFKYPRTTHARAKKQGANIRRIGVSL